MKKITKPWGWELWWAETDKYVGKQLHIEAGHSLSKQYHEIKDETIFVLCGKLILEIGDGETMERLVLPEGSSYHITPNTIHRFIAPSGGCDLMEVSTPETDDVVRLEDNYGRI